MNTLNSQQNLLPEENIHKKKVWILAFIFSFLALLVDGADLALLAYSLTSLKQEFSLSSYCDRFILFINLLARLHSKL